MALVVPNQQQPPLVDVLVLNWNGRRTLPRCLDALHRETYPTFQVTVIDNASTDGSPDLVRSFYSWATLLRLPENMGFGQAYNRAVGRSKADLIALLNNDAYPEPGWLAALVQAIQADHQAAACTSRIRLTHEGRETRDQRPETRDQRRETRDEEQRDEGRGTRDEAALAPLLHHAGGTLTYAGTGWDIGYGAPDGPAFDIPRPAGAFSGAAALLRRDAFLRAGGFDPSFFAYCEDADLSWTFWQLGYRILYVPGAAVAHEYGASGGGRHSPFRVRHAQRNRLASMLKHVEGARLPQALLLSLAFDLFRLAAYGARGRWSLVAALLTGSAGALRDLPATWRDRRRLSRLRLVPNAELERLGVLASPAAAIREYLRLEFLRGPVKGRAWERAGEKP